MQTIPIEYRELTCSYLYNMLQDLRHIVVFDLRGQDTMYIRDSINVNVKTTQDELQAAIVWANKKASQRQQKYKTMKKIRRYFIILQQGILTGDNQLVDKISRCLSRHKQLEDKYYSLSEPLSKFVQNYGFLCLNRQRLQELVKIGNTNELDRYQLYPYAKFPSEIVPNRLYISSVYSSNSQQQMKDLKIHCMFDFIDYKPEQKIPIFKQSYHYIHIPLNQDILVIVDFDVIMGRIDEELQLGRVLLYCKDGQSICTAFAIAYLMYKAKLNLSVATLKVCQAISSVNICKMLYNQLLVYKPGK